MINVIKGMFNDISFLLFKKKGEMIYGIKLCNI